MVGLSSYFSASAIIITCVLVRGPGIVVRREIYADNALV